MVVGMKLCSSGHERISLNGNSSPALSHYLAAAMDKCQIEFPQLRTASGSSPPS